MAFSKRYLRREGVWSLISPSLWLGLLGAGPQTSAPAEWTARSASSACLLLALSSLVLVVGRPWLARRSSPDHRRNHHLAVSCSRGLPSARPFPAAWGVTEIQANPFYGNGDAVHGAALEEGLVQQRA